MSEPQTILARADDAGVSQATNLGIRQCCVEGIARNVSLQAVAPAIEHAAELLKHLPGIAFGCHLTLTCEWTFPRFGPLSPVESANTLVAADGCFPHQVATLLEQNAELVQLMREAAAQLARLRELGLAIDYLDTHMGVSWLPGLSDRLADFCAIEKLIYVDGLVAAGRITGTRDAANAETPLLIVRHPMLPNVDRHSPHGPGMAAADVMADRDRERHDFLTGDLAAAVAAGRWQTRRFIDCFPAAAVF